MSPIIGWMKTPISCWRRGNYKKVEKFKALNLIFSKRSVNYNEKEGGLIINNGNLVRINKKGDRRATC